MDENPYSAPESGVGREETLRAGGVLEELTPAGSSIRVGPRERFDEAWIKSGVRVALLASLPLLVFVVPCVVLHILLVANPYGSPDWVQALLAILLLVVAVACLFGTLVTAALLHPWASGMSRGEKLIASFQSPRSAPESEFDVDFGFHPRLPGTAIEHKDTADDLGRLRLLPDRIVFQGDRTQLVLMRASVTRVRVCRLVPGVSAWKQWIGAVLAPNAVVELAEPLLDRSAIWLGLREGGHTLRFMQRSRQLARTLAEWGQPEAARDETSMPPPV